MTRTLTIETPFSDATLNIALDTLTKKKQALVFCNTKRSAESQAERIALKVKHQSAELLNISEQALKALPSPTKQCKRLAACLKKGIAFHHAGLHTKQRDLVETKFREGVIKIICSTPTLAMGLDMPAFRVIIRDLKRFGGGGWGMTDIPVLEYHQMCFPGETLIKTSKGELPIKDCEAGMRILSFDPKKKKSSYQPILKTFNRQATGLVRIKTTYGFSLKLTGNHPVYICREENFSWCKAADILPEDKILLSSLSSKEKKQDFSFFDLLPENNVYVPACGKLIKEVKERKKLSDRLLAKLLGMEKKNIYHYKYDKKAVPLSRVKILCKLLGVPIEERVHTVKSRYGALIDISQKIDKDILWLVGLIATDGTLTSTNDKRTKSRYVKICLSNMNRRIITKAQKILEQLVRGGTYLSQRDGGLFELEKGCTLLADIFRDHFGIPHNKKSSIVQVPPFLFHASTNLIGAYLAGVFDGDGSYSERRRILFTTGSKRFAFQIQQLLLRIGIIARVNRQKGGKSFFLKGKETFPLDSYTIHFTRIDYMKKFAELAPIVKAKIATTYKQYNNIHKFHDVKREFDLLAVEQVKRVPFKGEVFNLEVAKYNNYFANNFLVHNCGRAGRPGKEEYGEAIILAETKEQKEARTEQYIHGQPEEIFSKLAVEPVLRTYVLSLIASEFVGSRDGLYEFFSETFYAKQYGDTEKLHAILDAMVQRLEEWEFLTVAGSETHGDFVTANEIRDGKLEATLLGKRVAELYLDPYTAHFLITCLKRATEKGMNDFSLVHMLASCYEMRPWLRPKVREIERLNERTNPFISSLLAPEPVQYSAEYEEFLMTLKTALFFYDWIDEKREDTLMEELGIAPGEIRGKLDRADWLIYATEELARLLNYQMFRAPLARMRLRLKHGAREELLTLLKLKGIGRVRARKLFAARIRTIDDVTKAEFTTLAALLGKAVALNVKKQVGIELDPGKVQVKPNKRKGQKSIHDF